MHRSMAVDRRTRPLSRGEWAAASPTPPRASDCETDPVPSTLFQIEDSFHAEPHGDPLQDTATTKGEVRRILAIPFGEHPNAPPCGNPACQRVWEVVEYDTSSTPWNEMSRIEVAVVAASGVTLVAPGWLKD